MQVHVREAQQRRVLRTVELGGKQGIILSRCGDQALSLGAAAATYRA